MFFISLNFSKFSEIFFFNIFLEIYPIFFWFLWFHFGRNLLRNLILISCSILFHFLFWFPFQTDSTCESFIVHNLISLNYRISLL
jgi:hypothetical protein